MIPTPTELQYFTEIFYTKHLTKAAIKLGITQPTLTQSLASLEKKTGSKLFHRSKQGMTVTKEGQALFIKAQDLLQDWNTLASDIRMIREGLSGKLRVGCHQSVAAYCIPKLLSKISETNFNIELELIHDFSKIITEKVLSYDVDIGFVVNPSRQPDLVLHKIGTDRVSFWYNKSRKNLPKRIICDLNLNQINEVLKKSKSKMFKGWSIIQSSSLEVIRSITIAGEGVGIFPERVAHAESNVLSLYEPNELPSFEDAIYLVYRKDALTSRVAKNLVECAKISI